jgi:predicted flap endonuclease-1-like 5' DNA nuclease
VHGGGDYAADPMVCYECGMRHRRLASTAAATFALAAVLASCSDSGSTDTASPSTAAPSTTTSAAPAPTTTAEPTTTTVSPSGADAEPKTSAEDTIEFVSGLGPGTASYIEAVGQVYPLTTADEVNSFAGYAIGLCIAAEQEGDAFVRQNKGNIPGDFASNYSMTIDDEVAAAIVDNYQPACND